MNEHDARREDDLITARSEPLPEEVVAEEGGEDRRAEAAEILGDSEARIAAVAGADAPGDAADEHRTSADTA